MNDLDLVWLAGLLEGEGYFGITTRGNGSRSPVVEVKMTDLDVVERAGLLMGARSVTIKQMPEGQKTQYRARVTGKLALDLMIAALPHMGDRRTNRITEIVGMVLSGDLVAVGRGNYARVSPLNEE